MATTPSNQPGSPPADSPTTGVRRHHTISAHSRSARATAKDVISEETQEQQQQAIWNDDEVVSENWVGGVGAVGEKASLHRQASLPTRYHRAFHGQAAKSSNQTVNSLAAIAINDVDEEPWKLSTGNIEDDEQVPLEHTQQDVEAQSNISPFTNHPVTPPSPPPAACLRRNITVTYGAVVGGQQRKSSGGLKRSDTLHNPKPAHSQQSPSPPETSEQPESDYAYEQEDPSHQDEYLRQQQQQHPNAAIGASPWSPGYGNGSTAIDDVQRALSTLELASNPGNGTIAAQNNFGQYQQPQSVAHPPRFSGHQQHHSTGSRGSNGGGGGYYNNNNGSRASEYDGRKTPNSQRGGYVQQQQQQYGQQGERSTWDQKDLRGRASNPNLQYGYQQQVVGNHTKASSGSGVPTVPPIPPQYLQQSNQNGRQGLGVNTGFTDIPAPPVPSGQAPVQTFLETPVDIPTLIATKGYNPVQFDVRPTFARYFVIKSYTEDDVHKSLKYEIWSSTDPGNKRLDKAFKETAGRGPIYLFFSVNASGHFCGMAEMLTPVDYTRSSTVWASDKWKGVFKVRWIFVRDIPNATLRQIRLMNTQEKKPVTNSRDTQELLPDAGQEMLRIFHTHPARTSLLQDFAFYELQSIQKVQTAGTPPILSSPQLHAATVQNNNAGFNSYNMVGMGGGGGGGGHYGASQQGLHPQSQVMHQSVMRHPSPAPPQGQQQPQGNYGPF